MRPPLVDTSRLTCHSRSAYTLLFFNFRRSSDCMVYSSRVHFVGQFCLSRHLKFLSDRHKTFSFLQMTFYWFKGLKFLSLSLEPPSTNGSSDIYIDNVTQNWPILMSLVSFLWKSLHILALAYCWISSVWPILSILFVSAAMRQWSGRRTWVPVGLF